MRKAPYVGDVFVLCLYIHQHLWDCGSDETNVNKRQVAEEEIYKCMKVGFSADNQNDEQVPN
jgi:hypothetical protein